MGQREQRTLRAFEAVIRMQQLIVAKATDRERAEVCDEAILTLIGACIVVAALYPLSMSMHFLPLMFVSRAIYHDRIARVDMWLALAAPVASALLMVVPGKAELAAGMAAGLAVATLAHRVGMVEGLRRAQRLHLANICGIQAGLLVALLARQLGGKEPDLTGVMMIDFYLLGSSIVLTSAYAVWRARIDAAVKKEMMG